MKTFLLTFLILQQTLFSTPSTKKKALIIGISGQDGAYLSKFLLEKNYEVHGLVRSKNKKSVEKIKFILGESEKRASEITLHEGDLKEFKSISDVVGKIEPDEIYNLGAQSSVRESFNNPLYTADVNALGTLRILEAIKNNRLQKKTRLFNATSSELYGGNNQELESGSLKFFPRSPYAVSKSFSYWIVKNYRETLGFYACNGILCNHESPLRTEDFVTKKISSAVAKIAKNKQKALSLGNIDSKRDWGFAGDYVEAMWQMLQQDTAQDYTVITGNNYTVKEFVQKAFLAAGINLKWEGYGVDEKGINTDTGETVVNINPAFFRSSEAPVDYELKFRHVKVDRILF